MKASILVIDDEQDSCDLLKLALEHEGASVVACTSAKDALARLAEDDFDVVLTDLGMREMGGLEVCERIVRLKPELPIIVVTGQANLDAAVAAMRAGAYDFVTKPLRDATLISIAVARAVDHSRVRSALRRVRDEVEAAAAPSGIVGSSGAMRRVHEIVARIATGDATVLVQGETGTGKELVARRIHATGRRKDGPFVAINCAAIAPTLLESELFGHARGAFTDARRDRTGLFVQADGGTLFLDEVGEMPLEMQVKLLRALQERKVRPVGADKEIAFDVRLVTATNRDLEHEVEQKRFREDLYYRINVVRVAIPPLRERSSDVLELAHYFLRRHAERSGKAPSGLSFEATQKLVAYAWPGNVRELQNCIERAVALARFEAIVVDDLPEKIRNYQASQLVIAGDDPAELMPMEEVERRYSLRVLEAVSGNKAAAARILGIERKTLYRKLERWGSEPEKA